MTKSVQSNSSLNFAPFETLKRCTYGAAHIILETKKQKQSMIEPPEIIYSTKPILYETGYDEWPYAYAGSCFPARWKNKLYIVSAYHCFKNHQVDPEAILYPIPIKSDHFFGYCCKLRARVNEAKDLKHFDQILLQICPDVHSIEELGSVNAFDLSKTEMTISLSSQEVIDVWLRGFLLENLDHGVDFETCKLKQQAFVTNGFVSSRKSLFDYCHMLKVKTSIPDGMSPNGMSGSAVYVVDKDTRVKFAGTVIEHNLFTDEFLVIDSTVLCELLRTENA